MTARRCAWVRAMLRPKCCRCEGNRVRLGGRATEIQIALVERAGEVGDQPGSFRACLAAPISALSTAIFYPRNGGIAGGQPKWVGVWTDQKAERVPGDGERGAIARRFAAPPSLKPTARCYPGSNEEVRDDRGGACSFAGLSNDDLRRPLGVRGREHLRRRTPLRNPCPFGARWRSP